MSNERPNEFLPWRAKLTGVEATPGYGLDDTEQSWQRLAERLGKRPRRRGIVWWIAAACVIFVFLLPGTIFRVRPVVHHHAQLLPPTQRQPVTRAQSGPQPTPLAGGATLPAHDISNYGEIAAIRHPVKNHAPALVQTPTPNTGVTAGAPDTGVTPGAPDIGVTAGAPDTGVTAGAPDIGVTAGAPDTGVTAVALIPPARRQLRIAYLNELGKDPGPAAEPSFRRPAFLRLGAAGDWTTTASNTSTIKIDLFPHNH